MATKTVQVPEIGTVKLFKRKGSRSIRLSLGRKGDIRVTQPYWLPYSAGLKFVESKRSWLAGQLEKVTPVQLNDKQFIGKNHQLEFVASHSTSRTSARIKNGVIKVTHPAELAISEPEVQKAAVRAAQKALTLEAEKMLPDRLETLANKYNFSYNELAFKRLSSRWGSCDSHQNITLNIYLMTVPCELVDYVILHELNHTVIMQHGPKFWQNLEKILPNARQLSKQLHRHNTHF